MRTRRRLLVVVAVWLVGFGILRLSLLAPEDCPQVDDQEAEERESAARLGGGSRRLLGELLAPYTRALKLLLLIVLVENAARLAIPYLVKEGIDTGIPPIRADNNLQPLFVIVGIVLVATITQAVARQLFLVRSGKIGQDVALMVQNEVAEARLATGGGSSAMPHKSNPVPAEILVALARFNAGSLGTLHQALVHENERSGAAWTLEWMVLPPMVVTAAAGLRHARFLVDNLSIPGKE